MFYAQYRGNDPFSPTWQKYNENLPSEKIFINIQNDQSTFKTLKSDPNITKNL